MWRDYPGLSGWVLNGITSVLFKREAEKDLKTEEEEGHVIMAAGGERAI